jgi:hypothetical protein
MQPTPSGCHLRQHCCWRQPLQTAQLQHTAPLVPSQPHTHNVLHLLATWPHFTVWCAQSPLLLRPVSSQPYSHDILHLLAVCSHMAVWCVQGATAANASRFHTRTPTMYCQYMVQCTCGRFTTAHPQRIAPAGCLLLLCCVVWSLAPNHTHVWPAWLSSAPAAATHTRQRTAQGHSRPHSSSSAGFGTAQQAQHTCEHSGASVHCGDTSLRPQPPVHRQRVLPVHQGSRVQSS